MNSTSAKNVRVALLLTAAVLAGGAIQSFADEPMLRSSDTTQIPYFYGRAGGLVGSDRVTVPGKAPWGGAQVGVTHDKDIATRTNMGRSQDEKAGVGVTYDEDVAARTNMGRGQKEESASVAKSQQ